MMKSISWRILRVTLHWLVLIIMLMTSISIVVVSRIEKNDSEVLITQVCEKETLRFYNEFKLLEKSV